VTYIVPLVVLLVLVFYYWNLNRECTAQADFREYFEQQVKATADSDGVLSLADIIKFPWQQVKGFENFRPEHQKRSCPFNWNWSDEDRQSIIDSGLLSVLIFVNEGSIAGYIEFRNDRVSIDDFEKGLTPETARFKVERTGLNTDAFRLTVLP
jgi:predicted RND superfamily exporter protein